MKTDKDILQELQQIAPQLAKIEKKQPYQVPANYFEELPQAIQKEISLQNQRPKIWEWLYQLIVQPQYRLAVAVFVAVFIAGFYYFNYNTMNPAPEFNQLALEEMDTYINDNLDDFDESLLLENSMAMLDESTESAVEEMELTDEEIEDYLIDEADDQFLEEELL